jgi:hypothetical protein
MAIRRPSKKVWSSIKRGFGERENAAQPRITNKIAPAQLKYVAPGIRVL